MADPTGMTLDEGTFCAGCGYDLRAAAGERCPECGLRVDALRLQLPWERRRELGRIGSFCRTAWLATVRPGRLARGVAGRVDVPSARRFRRAVLCAAAAAVTVADVAVVVRMGGLETLNLVPVARRGVLSTNALALCWSAGAMVWPVLPMGLLLTLCAGTAWDHWFVVRHLSPVRRNRAMAGSRYTVAPLLGLVPAAGLIAVWLMGNPDPDLWAEGTVRILNVTGGTVVLVVVGLTWTGPARYAAAVPGGGSGSWVLVGTAVQWVVAIAAGLGLFPAVVGLVWVMVDGLR